MAIEPFNRRIRAGSRYTYITIPKWLTESRKLKIGQEYEFIVRIPEPKEPKNKPTS